jgi:hypothetical protein
MSKEALCKRTPQAVDIDGTEVYVRSLTMREAMKFDELSEAKDTDGALKAAVYAISRCLTDSAGVTLFEPDSDEVHDLPLDTMYRLSEAIKDVSRAAPRKVISKNYEAVPQ